MALVLVKEDGTGRSDANSYAAAADADAYYDGHLYASAWTAATTGNKEKALVFATRLIDSQFQFNGWRAHDSQALQWPRERCPDPDKGPSVSFQVLFSLGQYVEADEIPKAVVNATCEMARELLLLDRTSAPPGEGIDVSHTGHTDAAGSGAMGASDNTTTKYSKGDTRPVISHVAQAMLSKFGTLIGARSGSVTLKRV
jgi:hypothetical protein